MCGRYYINQWAKGLGIDPKELGLDELVRRWHEYHREAEDERYNIAPTATVPIILRSPTDDQVKVVPAQWGLVPKWTSDPNIAFKTFNARVETLTEKPSFRDPWRRGRRCLIPMSGYYEWTQEAGFKQSHAITRADATSIAAAGLWEFRSKPEALTSCTIITVDAGPDTESLHDRAPAILNPNTWMSWLDLDDRRDLLQPPEAGTLIHRRVSRYVSKSSNEGPACRDDPEPTFEDDWLMILEHLERYPVLHEALAVANARLSSRGWISLTFRAPELHGYAEIIRAKTWTRHLDEALKAAGYENGFQVYCRDRGYIGR